MKRLGWCCSLLLTLAACGHQAADKDYAAMNTIPLRATCIGRVSIDMPQKGSNTWSQRIGDANVTQLPLTVTTPDAFWKVVEQRREELAAQKHESEGSLLTEYRRVDNNVALILHRESTFDVFGYDLDGYLWLEHYGYVFLTKARPNQEKERLINDVSIFKQIIPYENANPSTKPGFCIDRAIVTGPVKSIVATSSVDMSQWKGVSFYVGVREPVDPNDSDNPYQDLKDIEKGAKESMSESTPDHVASFEVLRKRDRVINGFPGQETAIKSTLANGRIYYRLRWETLPEGPGLQQGVVAGLDAGSPTGADKYVAPPPVNDLFSLWDAMLDSLKRN
jgi:hypothetical protein